MSDDLALDALLGIKLNLAPELSTDLLKKCYDLQKRHQFDHDRVASTQAMDRMIEEEVTRLVAKEELAGKKS
jgi:hypothetical protein